MQYYVFIEASPLGKYVQLYIRAKNMAEACELAKQKIGREFAAEYGEEVLTLAEWKGVNCAAQIACEEIDW